MEVVYECCCGIDVHKKMIVACLMNGRKHELRQFGTTTGEIREMASWMKDRGCQMAAAEGSSKR